MTEKPSTETSVDPYVGIVLCGGRSKRMGFDKALLPFGEETMLQRIVGILRRRASEIIVVSRPELQLPKLDRVTVAFDQRDDYGPLEGIRVGLSVAHEKFGDTLAFVTSCDVPLLRVEFVDYLLANINSNRIAVPVDDRFKHPLSAVYRTDVFRDIEILQQQNVHRPVALFERVPTVEIHVNRLRGVDPELQTLANLNHPNEYFSVLDQLNLNCPDNVRQQLQQN